MNSFDKFMSYVFTLITGTLVGLALDECSKPSETDIAPRAIYQTTIDGTKYLTVKNGLHQRYAFAQASPHLNLWTRIEKQTEDQISQTRSNQNALVQKVLGKEASK